MSLTKNEIRINLRKEKIAKAIENKYISNEKALKDKEFTNLAGLEQKKVFYNNLKIKTILLKQNIAKGLSEIEANTIREELLSEEIDYLETMNDYIEEIFLRIGRKGQSGLIMRQKSILKKLKSVKQILTSESFKRKPK